MSKHYEDLSGAEGRARLFRPARFDSPAIFGGAAPTLHFDDEVYSLANLSAVGFGAQSHATSDRADVAARRGVIKLTQRGRELFAAAGMRTRAVAQGNGVFCGFAIESTVLDIAELKRANARALAETTRPVPSVSTVSSEYKEFCADAACFIGAYLALIRQTIEPFEAAYSSNEADDIARNLAAAAAPGWMELVERGNRLVLPIQRDKVARNEWKAFTERVVLPSLLEGEGFARTYLKPLGYPGDFQIMNYIYDGAPIGSSVRARFLHLLSLVGAEPVNTRLVKLVDILVDCANRFGPDVEISALSVGCGPAREVEHLLKAAPSRKWRLAMIDQEPLALECAVTRTSRLLAAQGSFIKALHVSFRDMLDPGALSGAIGRQHVIYSSGLVDYLSPLMARRLVGRLYDMIEPGGAVIIGNVNNSPTGMMWPSEFLVDWTLYFRDPQEMRDIAAELGDAEISVATDSRDAIVFLVARKPITNRA